MRFIELFAGIGGFRYGLETVNEMELWRCRQKENKLETNSTNIISQSDKRQFTYSCVYANEIDKYASQIYQKNYGEAELYEGDIRTITAKSIPDFDLITGGFPCQSFSIAGKRKGFGDTRGTLFFEICRIVEAKRPHLLLLENVKGLLNHDSGNTFRIILDSLSELGYDCEWEVLNSKNFGVPQNRERVFIVGHLRGTSRGQIFPIGEDDTSINKENRGKSQLPTTISGTITTRFGDRYQDTFINQPATIDLYHFLHGEKRPVTSRIMDDGNSATISSALPPSLINKNRIRRLTPTECERLQGFPDGWTKGISDTQRYKCLGNAVTTNVITEIGKKILTSQ